MKYRPDGHHCHSMRLPGYDYTRAGAYFVTICTQNRECLFGEIRDEEMRLNHAGRMAERCWQAIPKHFPQASIDAFIVMPNHVHGVVVLEDADLPPDVTAGPPPDATVGARHAVPLRHIPAPALAARTLPTTLPALQPPSVAPRRQRPAPARMPFLHGVRNTSAIVPTRNPPCPTSTAFPPN